MTGFIEDTWLRMNGATDQDIAAINALLPRIQALVTVLKQYENTIKDTVHVGLPILLKVIAKQRELR